MKEKFKTILIITLIALSLYLFIENINLNQNCNTWTEMYFDEEMQNIELQDEIHNYENEIYYYENEIYYYELVLDSDDIVELLVITLYGEEKYFNHKEE